MPYDALPEEIECLAKHGCTPMQAIEAATRIAGIALGECDHLGTVERGKCAVLITVDRESLKYVSALKEVSWVMKDGMIVPFAPEYNRLAGKTPWLATHDAEPLRTQAGASWSVTRKKRSSES